MSAEKSTGKSMTEPDAISISQHLPRMFRVALRMLGDRDDAHEVVQDACVKALRGADRFDGRSDPATWLHRITVNCARDLQRNRKRTARNTSSLNDELDGMHAAIKASPSTVAEKEELYRIASALVAELPDECRTAFILTQLDGYSYDEAAAIQEQPRGTIASRVHRAKKLLLGALNARTERRASR
jgi:RNA polymerase sigma-70 factor (ECF subfamily)